MLKNKAHQECSITFSMIVSMHNFKSETSMMGGIIPEKNQRKVFDMLIQSGLDSIVKEGEVRQMLSMN